MTRADYDLFMNKIVTKQLACPIGKSCDLNGDGYVNKNDGPVFLNYLSLIGD